MSTGQFPKRRETDAQAKRRVEGIERRREELEGQQRSWLAAFHQFRRLQQAQRRVQERRAA